MRLLLDTHAFLWWVGGERPLGRRARAAVADPGNEVLLSIASFWEIAIKISLGRLGIGQPLSRFIAEQLRVNAFSPLEIGLAHAARVAILPFHHRDPFDRMLIAQALQEDLTIVSADRVFGRYGVPRVWA